MTTQGAAALVGIFHLRLHAGAAEIDLGADARAARSWRPSPGSAAIWSLSITSTTTGPGARPDALDLAEHLQRREQARDADGEAGRRHRLAAEARDQTVIAPAAADRAEAHGAAVLVLHLEGQLGLVDRAGVVFEAAHDGGIDDDAASP